MIAHFISRRVTYNGSQLTSHWALRHHNIQGDCIVAFIGSCFIPRQNIVDLKDLKTGAKIFSRLMLHFIIEHFELDLEKAILRQRLFAGCIKALIEQKTGQGLNRCGDDLFDGPAKLSISIATLTSISSKIHFGLNIDSRGTPVKAKGLKDYKIPAKPFAIEAMTQYITEQNDIQNACCTVKGIR